MVRISYSVTTINSGLDIAQDQNINDENNEEWSNNQLLKFENSTYREVVLPLILGAPLSALNAVTVPLLRASTCSIVLHLLFMHKKLLPT